MSKSNKIGPSWRIALKNSNISETDNPFTPIGLITAIIEDLNQIRLKIVLIENYIISKQYCNKLIFKESNEKEKFKNDK
jgi:hypothetical protein